MKRNILSGFVAFFIMTVCPCITPYAVASDEDDVIQVMENFDMAINTKNSELLSSLYFHSPKTTYFAPSQDGAFLTQGWLEGGPEADLVFSLHHPQVIMLTDNVAVATGYHTATNTDPATGEQNIAQIRQTLVLQKIGGKWLIVHEHASMFPTD